MLIEDLAFDMHICVKDGIREWAVDWVTPRVRCAA
jgi:hypothetical protein